MAEADDEEIDQLEIRIDEMVVTFISTHAVVATDTRFVLTASKIANNLERIADEAQQRGSVGRDDVVVGPGPGRLGHLHPPLNVEDGVSVAAGWLR